MHKMDVLPQIRYRTKSHALFEFFLPCLSFNLTSSTLFTADEVEVQLSEVFQTCASEALQKCYLLEERL